VENYFLLFYPNLLELQENYLSIILFQSSGIAGKLSLYYFIPIFANWKKLFPIILSQSSQIGKNYFPNKIATLLQQFFIYIVFLPYFGYSGGIMIRY
jgi:hypothetical protein